VRIWDPVSGVHLRTLKDPGVRALVVGPDGRWLASAAYRTVRIWALGRFRRLLGLSLLGTLKGHSGVVRALVVGPDGRWLASADSDGTVRIWALGRFRRLLELSLLRTLIGHSGGVEALAVGPDGRWLASAGNDRTVRIWDPATGAQLAILVGDANGSAALFPDGQYRVDGAPAGVWWVAGLCRFEPSEIDEIARYVPGLRRREAEP